MKFAMWFILSVSGFFNCGCATFQDYRKAHNQFLDNTIQKLNEPETKEHIKTGYFLVVPNPYETGLRIDSLGTSAFDYMQCKIDKFNSRYPAADFGNYKGKPFCQPEDK